MHRHSIIEERGSIDGKLFPFFIYETGKIRNVRKHDHDFWEIVYVYEGWGTCTIGDRTFEFHSRQLILTPPFISHSFLSHDDSRHRQVSIAAYSHVLEDISIAWAPIKELLDRIKKNQHFCITVPEESALDVERRIDSIRWEFLFRPRNCEVGIILDLTHLLISVDRFLYGGQESFRWFKDFPVFVCSALETIEISFHKIHGLDDILQGMKIDKRYFIRIFKKHVKLTPIAYLNRVRIEKSCEFLLHTHLPVVQIGMDVGFNDLRHFNRQFKNHTGVTPSEFRKRSPQDPALIRHANRFHSR